MSSFTKGKGDYNMYIAVGIGDLLAIQKTEIGGYWICELISIHHEDGTRLPRWNRGRVLRSRLQPRPWSNP